MAKARTETRTVKKMIEVEHHEAVYVLELSLDEMKALRAVYNKVSGDMDNSPRKHVESVSVAIDNVMAGSVKYNWRWAQDVIDLSNRNPSGGVHFDKYPLRSDR